MKNTLSKFLACSRRYSSTYSNMNYYNKKARQWLIGQFVVPARPRASRGRRPREARGLEGTTNCPISHWRAFFILFHHFRRLKRFNLLNNSRTISQPCAAVRHCATAGRRFTVSMSLSIISACLPTTRMRGVRTPN